MWLSNKLIILTGILVVLSGGCGSSIKENEIRNTDEYGRTALHESVILGDEEGINWEIAEGQNVNKQDRYGFSPLHYAARDNFMNAAELLLGNGANPNRQDHYLASPLHHAALKGNSEIVELLLNWGADIYLKDKNGDSPLDLAKQEKNYSIIRLLLPVYRAVSDGDLGTVKLLLRSNPALLNQNDPFGRAPLHWAYRFDRKEIADYLITTGADISARDSFGNLPVFGSLENQKKRNGVCGLSPQKVDRLDWIVLPLLDTYPEINIGMVVNGETVLTRTYGKGKLNKQYAWGSVSKPVTAMVVHRLTDQGKIRSLDDNIWDYSSRYKNCLPERFSGSNLSIRHLLLHRSGVPHNRESTWKNGKLNLKFNPGSADMYSTPGYGILGHLIEDIAGMTFNRAVEEHIGKPVGDDSFDAAGDFRAPGARVRSTILGMARFAEGIINHKYVPEKVMFGQILKPQKGEFGMGWPLRNPDSPDLSMYHGGSNGRPQAYLEIKPKKGMAVAILAISKNPQLYLLQKLGRELLTEIERF